MADQQRQQRLEFTVRDAELIFKNFEGREGKFNPKGARNFCCFLPEDVAETMAEDGWHIRRTKPRDDEYDSRPYIQVTVNFNNRPPNVQMISSAGRTKLDADTIEILDWADIEKVDFKAVSFNWIVGENSGITAYLKTLFVTLREDELEREYASVDEDMTLD